MARLGENVLVKDNIDNIRSTGYYLAPFAEKLVGRWGVITNIYLNSFLIEFDGGSATIWLPRYAFSTISEIRKQKLTELNIL